MPPANTYVSPTLWGDLSRYRLRLENFSDFLVSASCQFVGAASVSEAVGHHCGPFHLLYVGSSPGQRQRLSLLCLHPGGSQAMVFPGGPSACSARAEVAAVGEQVVNRL